MIDLNKIAALAEKAVATGTDMTQAQQGGGDYTPPPEGPCNLRLISYIELGKHAKTIKGVTKVTARVQLVFEVSGKRYPAVTNETTGEVMPVRITIEENLSLNEKANFFKLFTRMNYAGKAKHMAQLVGQAFRGTVVHDKWKGKDGKERITAALRDASGYTVVPPRVEDEDSETGYRVVEVAPAISQYRVFLWDHADMDQWTGLFIDGQYPERKDDKGVVTAPAKSKNVIQNRIKLAVNFTGSPIHTLLVAGGLPLDLPEPETGDDADGAPERDETLDIPGQTAAATPTGAAAADALNGIV